MKIDLKTNFSSFFTLLFIFLELWTIFRDSKLLSAWKIEFQDYFRQVFDIADLKNNFYIIHRLKNAISNFVTIKLTFRHFNVNNSTIS